MECSFKFKIFIESKIKPNSIDKNQKVAAYELKNVKDGDCFYEYIETIIYKEYSKKYTDLF